MFRLALHMVRSRHAIFYFRFVVPRCFRHCGKRPELRLSLHTRDPRKAKRLAVLLWLRLHDAIQAQPGPMADKKKPAFSGTWKDLKRDLKQGTLGQNPVPGALDHLPIEKLVHRQYPDGSD